MKASADFNTEVSGREEEVSVTSIRLDDEETDIAANEALEEGENRCKFCACPNGRRPLLLSLVATTLALALADTATDVCAFVTTTGDRPRKIGINKYEDSELGCVPWREGDDRHFVYDTVWDSVRWMVGIASVVSAIAWILLIVGVCYFYPFGRFFNNFAYVYLGVTVLYSLSFIVVASDICLEEGCKVDDGVIIMIVACLLWFVACWVVLLAPFEYNTRMSSGRESPLRSDRSHIRLLAVASTVCLAFVLVVNLVTILVRN